MWDSIVFLLAASLFNQSEQTRPHYGGADGERLKFRLRVAEALTKNSMINFMTRKFLNRSEFILRVHNFDMCASRCPTKYRNVNFSIGVDNETNFEV